MHFDALFLYFSSLNESSSMHGFDNHRQRTQWQSFASGRGHGLYWTEGVVPFQINQAFCLTIDLHKKFWTFMIAVKFWLHISNSFQDRLFWKVVYWHTSCFSHIEIWGNARTRIFEKLLKIKAWTFHWSLSPSTRIRICNLGQTLQKKMSQYWLVKRWKSSIFDHTLIKKNV